MRNLLLTLSMFCISLAGCTNTNTVTSTINTTLQSVGGLTITDLQAADVDAKAHNDTIASTCYEAVIPLVQKAQSTSLKAPVGLVSGFQNLRDGISATQGAQGLIKQLEVPCGPLAVDVNLTLAQLIAQFAPAAAATAVSGGIVPLLP